MKSVKIIVTAVLLYVGLLGILAFIMVSSKERLVVPRAYEITNKWILPSVLDEVSGIAWLSENTFACIQDEDGIIFIYDVDQQQLIDRIPFSKPSDFEGIAVLNDDAYVMRSDGVVFKVARFRKSENRSISKFKTDFTVRNNMETLTPSADGNSLLTIPKSRDKDKNFKGIYEIDLASQTVKVAPRIRIRMDDDAFKEDFKKKVRKTFNPSDMAVHPSTGYFYVLEGIHPKIAILNQDGEIENVVYLETSNFPQPEGIAFSPDGRLFIANEADGNQPSIIEIQIYNNN